MDLGDAIQDVLGDGARGGGIGDVEGVLEVTSRVSLGDEEGVKVPEGALDVSVCGHFGEAHFKEDLTEFLTDLHEGMQVTRGRRGSGSGEVVLFKGSILPGLILEHVDSDISLLVAFSEREIGALGDGVGGESLTVTKLSTLEILEDIRLGVMAGASDLPEVLLGLILDGVDETNEPGTILLNPLVLESLALADFGGSAELGCEVSHLETLWTSRNGVKDLCLMGSSICNLLTFLGQDPDLLFQGGVLHHLVGGEGGGGEMSMGKERKKSEKKFYLFVCQTVESSQDDKLIQRFRLVLTIRRGREVLGVRNTGGRVQNLKDVGFNVVFGGHGGMVRGRCVLNKRRRCC